MSYTVARQRLGVWLQTWTVEFHEKFDAEMQKFPLDAQDEILALANMLAATGPRLGRPQSDTLNGSSFANVKELRFNAANGVWRVAYAFDPERKAILLVAGDKTGINQRRFYSWLIRIADERFRDHLNKLTNKKEN